MPDVIHESTQEQEARAGSVLDTNRLHQDLELIKRMVAQSRRVRARTGDIYLVVGALLVIAGIVDALVPGGVGWVAWPIGGGLGWLYAVISGVRRGAPQGHVSYAPRVEGVAWTVACCGVAITVLLSQVTGAIKYTAVFPLIALLLATPLAVSGALYRYWPLTAGGGLFVAYALACVWLPPPALGPGFIVTMVLGYVAPGVGMLRIAAGE